jgi:hypothetical protein
MAKYNGETIIIEFKRLYADGHKDYLYVALPELDDFKEKFENQLFFESRRLTLGELMRTGEIILAN